MAAAPTMKEPVAMFPAERASLQALAPVGSEQSFGQIEVAWSRRDMATKLNATPTPVATTPTPPRARPAILPLPSGCLAAGGGGSVASDLSVTGGVGAGFGA